MAFYSLTYEIIDQKFMPVDDFLEKISNKVCCQVLDTQWLLHTTMPARDLLDHLKHLIGENNKILLIEIDIKKYYQTNLDDEAEVWLRRQKGYNPLY